MHICMSDSHASLTSIESAIKMMTSDGVCNLQAVYTGTTTP